MTYYLYRVEIVQYPDGALFTSQADPENAYVDPSWEPEGWDPDDEWEALRGSTHFFWPSTKREYKSRSSAMQRKRLIESYGAKCILQRSSAISWPDDGQETLPEPKPVDAVTEAIKTLVKAGVLSINFGGAE